MNEINTPEIKNKVSGQGIIMWNKNNAIIINMIEQISDAQLCRYLC